MASGVDFDLASVINDLQLVDGISSDDWIDHQLHQVYPRKRARPTSEEIEKELEDNFLTPSHQFSTEWLNRVQTRWKQPTDYTQMMDIAPTMSRTIFRFTREGLEGRVTGYKEVTVPAHSITAKNSTSLLRKPATKTEMVRGKVGFYPFAPGGMDIGVAAKSAEDLEIEEAAIAARMGEDGLLQVPPGFTRGLAIEDDTGKDKDMDEAESFSFGEVQPIESKKEMSSTTKTTTRPVATGIDEIDELLPVEYAVLAPRGDLAAPKSKSGTKEWAHMVDVNKDFSNFRELVPNMAREWPFELDIFQKEAVYHLENGDSVFVAAHTSAGKTVVAEYGIALAAKHMTKAIYTSPIKALSNQKFRDFRNVFDDVGILTGDVQINPEASCLIMTTEILRSMLYRGADIIRDVEFVIFDEVHYVNDAERGVVWEEVIIMLPEHVNLILLSATVPNTFEFANWVGRTKKKDIYVISTPKRPVPLEHFLWANKAMYKIVNAEKQFLTQGIKDVNNALNPPQRSDQLAQRGGTQRGRGADPRGRGGPNQRGGRGGGPGRGPTNAGTFTRSGRGGVRTTAAQDKNIWNHLVQHLKKETLLPAVIFVFSKRRCEENADSLSNIDFCNATEKSAIHMTVEKSLARLKPEDRNLPQIRRMRELLSRGLAVHHGGLLPIVKEVVEILFARTLVKVLFATETFAMGLNLPTRTVVFSGLRKHDGQSFRDLEPGEYIQMAGRAGRRGLDSFGTVIIISPLDQAPADSTLRNMILGQPRKLKSQFRLTYNMILNLLRVEALKIEEMIKRSFGENTTQNLLPQNELEIVAKQGQLKDLFREPCTICDVDKKEVYEAIDRFNHHTKLVMQQACGAFATAKQIFVPGRVVVVWLAGGTNTRALAVIRAWSMQSGQVSLIVLAPERSGPKPDDSLPFEVARHVVQTEQSNAGRRLFAAKAQAVELLAVTSTKLDFDFQKAAIPSQDDGVNYNGVLNSLLAMEKNQGGDQLSDYDFTKHARTIEFEANVRARKEALEAIMKSSAITCPQFLRHHALFGEEFRLQQAIDALKKQTSDQNLALLPDYEQRIEVLKELEFIDEQTRVQLKGRVACEINSASELVLTELILDNFFASYEPEEICALLSAFVFQEKTDVVPTVTPKLEDGKKRIIEISKKVNSIQEARQVAQNTEVDDFESRPRFGLMEVVYEWAKGMSFNQITDLTDVLEGTIVRVITRLDECCREVKNAARTIGDPSLFTKMQTCQELIKRDVCHCASLYL